MTRWQQWRELQRLRSIRSVTISLVKMLERNDHVFSFDLRRAAMREACDAVRELQDFRATLPWWIVRL